MSYVHGASSTPLLGTTISQALDRAVDRWPDAEALIVRHQAVRWTWRELRDRADAFAAGLIAIGLQAGDRVGIWSPNNAEWVVAQFATARAGVILVNINPAYRLTELEYALNRAGCAALIMATSFRTSDYVAMMQELAPELSRNAPGRLVSRHVPQLRHVISLGETPRPGMYRFVDLPAMAREQHRAQLHGIARRQQFDDPVNIQFTSGTTGFPKGATLSHHNILNNGFFVGEALGLSSRDRLCIPVPLYHCFGMVMGNLACVTHGSAMVYPGEAFSAQAVLEAVQEERCTGLYGVPTMFIAVLDHPERAAFATETLRTGIMAGSPCPVEVMKRVVTELNMRDVTICYGMTETSPVSFQTGLDDPIERRVGSVGRVHPHVEVKIVDADGCTVPRGVAGELCTRGYSVMIGYWGDPAATRDTVDASGWMHTGDLATIDDDGYCNIVGRIKDMVIRGGENIYPREIEEFLYRHPAVQDVQVIGVPDPTYGEELCAWVRLKPGRAVDAADIRAFCKDRIAHYKIPRYVKFVDGFPLTVTGKVQKYRMREIMAQELGLESGRVRVALDAGERGRTA